MAHHTIPHGIVLFLPSVAAMINDAAPPPVGKLHHILCLVLGSESSSWPRQSGRNQHVQEHYSKLNAMSAFLFHTCVWLHCCHRSIVRLSLVHRFVTRWLATSTFTPSNGPTAAALFFAKRRLLGKWNSWDQGYWICNVLAWISFIKRFELQAANWTKCRSTVCCRILGKAPWHAVFCHNQ